MKTTHSLVSFDVWDSVGKIRGFVNVDTHGVSNPIKYGVEIQPGRYLIGIKEYICTTINDTKLIQIIKICEAESMLEIMERKEDENVSKDV